MKMIIQFVASEKKLFIITMGWAGTLLNNFSMYKITFKQDLCIYHCFTAHFY